ncbi:SCO family protein [Nocardioides sp.]|uniref:SCO family protein n=1 Tax=Nocardioides sp. TaxID=35761 RepID=UPI002639F2D0|nr:SCO family protein [Nocardioides sp.]
MVVPFSGHVISGPAMQASSTALVRTSDDQAVDLARPPGRRLTLLFFGYTKCEDFCPMVLTNLAMAMSRLDPDVRNQVAVVFVTTDPQRDTAEVVNRYLKHIDPAFVGVRGPIADVAALARSVGVYVDAGGSLEGGGYDPGEHGTLTVALDSRGRSKVFWPMETVAKNYAADIAFMLEGAGTELRVPLPAE